MFDPFSKVGALTRRLHQISLRVFSEEVHPYGLTTVQFGALQAIADHSGIDQVSLGVASDIDRTTVMRVLNRLEKHGLVRRKPCPQDKRINRVYITAVGKRMISDIEPLADASQQRLLEPLAPDERAAFMNMLTKLVLAHSSQSLYNSQNRHE